MSDRRVFLVDDHPLIRRGLGELLSTEEGIEVCGEAESVAAAMETFNPEGCDLAIIDLSLGGLDGLELVKRLTQCWPEVPVLVYSMHEESFYAQRALAAGARGYLQKQEPPERVLEAVRRILDGQVYLSPEMSQRLQCPDGDPATHHPVAQLSDRELEVFDLLGRAHGTRQIAERLRLSHKTIESHRENIKRKLGLSNHNELMRRAVLWVQENR